MSAKRLRRSERGLGERPKTLKARQLVAEVRREGAYDVAVQRLTAEVKREAEHDEAMKRVLEEAKRERPQRPQHRSDCERGPRPCPWVGCRFHLYLDVKEAGHLRYNFPDRDLEDLEETCALDVAESGKHTLERVGDLINMGRDHLLRLERAARAQLKPKLTHPWGDEESDGKKGDF